MSDNKLLSRLFSMKGFCVSWHKFEDTLGELHVGVKPRKTGCRCPHCGQRGVILRRPTGIEECRHWDDVVVCGRRVVFVYAPREIKCPTHGRVQERIPWADTRARITYRLEYLILVFCQIMTQKAAAELLHMASSTLSDVLHRLITRLRDGHRIIDIEKLGLDEISYCKGSKFATIVYDLERKCVVWVAAGKGRATIDEFFKNVITKEQREKVRFASCDMSKTYMGAIKTWCTNAVLVIDRFHIVKALNEAVDAVRKDAWHEAKGDQKKVLKGLRWLLYKHSRNRTKAETQNLKNLNKSNRHIFRASVLKDEFEAFWNFVNPAAAESFLKGWITAALKSRIPSLRTFAKTLKTYATDILSFIGTNVNNAVAEGINRVIKIVKNRASGFANLNAFTDMIFLTVGDLDLPMQIPEPFRLF